MKAINRPGEPRYSSIHMCIFVYTHEGHKSTANKLVIELFFTEEEGKTGPIIIAVHNRVACVLMSG